MRKRGDQDGRQPALPIQPLPPSKSHTETEKEQTTDQPKQICRNYVWGTCPKNAKCKFRHELDVEEMKKILIFCHDYQNRTGCTREDCKYLHTTKEEKNLFLTTGQIPRVLAERHAAMSAMANVKIIPQIAFIIKDSYKLRTGSYDTAPPPPPHTTPMVFRMNQPPPPLPVMFDASRPPPPLPTQVLLRSGAVKHKSSNSCEGLICAGEKWINYLLKRNIKIYFIKRNWRSMKLEKKFWSLVLALNFLGLWKYYLRQATYIL